MPAEYEPHKGTILIWPKRPGSWIYGAKKAREAFADVICAAAESETVYLLVEAGELDHAKTAQEDAEKLKADYEARLANVDKEADEILSAARAKALANEADIVAKAREEASRIIAHAHVEAELEKKKAADEIKQEMVGLAMDAAGKFVRVSMDDRTKNALIEETLAEIGENTWLS